MNHQEQLKALEGVLNDPSADPIQLSHEFLGNITENFADENVIGSGGFGIVYSGFVNNVKVAVKKLSQTGDFSDVQFGDELKCLQRVKHKNIVRCLGYCSDTIKEAMPYKGKMVMAEDRRKYICFEYAPNQSLLEFLKDESCTHKWETRYQLIVGICQGLQYLHNKERINHLDLKPANILLDADMVPKITDFGLSRRFSGAQSRKITERIRGSLGYIAPEYWNKGEISFKSDIYSLGVIIKNILKGSTDLSNFDNWYKSLDLGPQLKRCIEIALQCVDNDQRKRPTIDSVIEMLNVKGNKVQLVSVVSGQSRNRSSQQQAISSISKSADGMQSLPVSAGPSPKQREQINGELRGPGEQSTEASSSSVSKSTDNNMHYKVVSTEPLSSHHHHHQQQRIVSVLKGPAEEITEGNNFVPNLLDEAQPMSNLGPPSLVVQQNEQITTIPNGPGETNSNEAVSKESEEFPKIILVEYGHASGGNSFVRYLLDEVQSISASGPGETIKETSKLLDVHPQELCFPFERNELIRCPLTLTNRTEHSVGVWITLTYPDKRSGLRFPVMCGKEYLEDTACSEILGPHSTLAVSMTMKELREPPPCDTAKFEVLMILMSQKEHLEKLNASNMDDFLKTAQELKDDLVHRVALKASIRDRTSCQAVIPNYKFMPTRTSSFRDIERITDVHPIKTWFLVCQKEGREVLIWDYQTQKKWRFVQITKVGSRERRRPSREPQFPPNLARNEEDRRLVRGERPSASPPSLPEDLYPQQEEVDPAQFREDRVEVAAEASAGHWRRGEGRRPRHGRYDDVAWGSWGGARRRRPPTNPRRASSSRRRTYAPPTSNDQCLDVRSAKFITREQWLAIGDDDGCVHVYDYSTAAVAKVTEFTAHDGGIVDLLSVHPTRQLLLTAYSYAGKVKLWNWDQEWNCTREFNVHNTRLLRLSWNPSDTNVFATLSKCNTLKLWKTDSSDPSTTMEGMNRADYLCSGSQRHLMVTTSHLETNDKKSAMIWDLQTKNDVHRLGLSGCDIYDIACHPTLPILATSHSDGSIVCLWNTRNYRLETILQLPESHNPGLIFITSTEDVTRLVTQCQGGTSIVEIKMPTSTWTGIHNGGEN